MSILQTLGYPNRIVALLTPIVAPLAGWFTSWIADRVPGIPKSALDEIFIAGSILVLAPALQFIHGRLKWDLLQDQKQAAVLAAAATAPAPSATQFDEIGIAPPTATASAAAAEPAAATQDGDEDLGDDGDAIDAIAAAAPDDAAGVDEEEEDASTDILDEVDGLLDDEEEPVPAGS